MLRMYSLMLALTLGLTGCASTGSKTTRRRPTFPWSRSKWYGPSCWSRNSSCTFAWTTRDDADLTVRGLVYKVSLGNLVLTEGESNEWLTVPPRGHKFFKVSVRTNLWPQVREVVQMLKNPDRPVPYRLEGELKTGLFIGNDVQVAHNGEIIPGDFIPEQHR